MGSFNASLKTIGDTRGLPATVKLEEGRLSIIAGDAPIGDWPLGEIGLDPVPRGYRLAAEGEQLIIEMDDSETFAEELAKSSKKGRKRGIIGRKATTSDEPVPTKPAARQEPEPRPAPKKPERRGLPGATVLTDSEVPRPSKSTAGLVSRFRNPAPKAAEAPAKPERSRRARKEKPEREKRTVADKAGGSGVVGLLDRAIDATERRWGPLLPEWVFNRIVFVSAFVLFAAALVFRGITSIVLLIAGVLALMVGGASYTDDVMASKLLPGRTTPTHVLVMGIALIALGILFGIIA